MYSLSPELYHEAAHRLCAAIGCENYFSGSVTFLFGDTECRLTASVVVYRKRLSLPEGVTEAICDLIPVWWEFHTTAQEGEVINDFCFTELKGYIV